MDGPSSNHDETGREGRSRRVLIIEDNRDSAELLAMCLAAEGIEALTAHDGVGGLEVARKHRPDVVVCDIGLPGLDGYGVAETLRKESSCRFAAP